MMQLRDGEQWLIFEICDDGRVMGEKQRDSRYRWEQCGGYVQLWEIRGLTWLIGWGRLLISVIHGALEIVTTESGMVYWPVRQINLFSGFTHWLFHLLSSCSLLYPTLPSFGNTKLSHHTLALNTMVTNYHCTIYTQYCIYRILRHLNINHLPLSATLSFLGRWCCTECSTFPQFRVNKCIESQLLTHHFPDLLPPGWLPPTTSTTLLYHGLQVHLHTHLITVSRCN